MIKETQPAVLNPKTGTMVQPTTTYTYDAYGDMLTETDADGNVTTFTYDAYGDELTRTLPQATGESTPPQESFTYNNFGQVLTHTDFDGNVTVYSYNPATGLVVEEDLFKPGDYSATATPDEKITTTYTPLDQVWQVTDSASGTVTYTYDMDGNVTQVTSPQGTINYGYNLATDMHTSTTTNDSSIQYGYNALGELTSVTVLEQAAVVLSPSSVSTETYQYDDAGNLEQSQVEVGTTIVTTSAYTYDQDNHVQTLNEYDGQGNLLASYDYLERYSNGDIEELQETVKQPNGTMATDTTTYQYDALDRLTQETVTSGGSSILSTSFTLDLVGNQVSETTITPGQTETTASMFDARNELRSSTQTISGAQHTTTYQYDANGSLVTTVGPDGTTTTYTYDMKQQLVAVQAKTSAGVVTYTENLTYSPQGIVTSRTLVQGGTTTTSVYLIDAEDPSGYAQVLEVKAGSGNFVSSFVYGLAPSV